MMSKGGPCLHWGVAQTKRTDETKWRNGGIYPFSKQRCLYPSSLSFYYIRYVFFPHLLWASVEITGEISVCGRACLSSRGSRGKGGGVWGKRKDWEGEEKETHALQYCCVVCGTLPFVCLAITYSAQGHSSRGWARASVKTENNEATAAQRIAFSLCLGRPPPSSSSSPFSISSSS